MAQGGFPQLLGWSLPPPRAEAESPWAMSSSRSRATSSCSSRMRRALGSSLMTALQRICLVRSAYLSKKGGLAPVRASREPLVYCLPPLPCHSGRRTVWQEPDPGAFPAHKSHLRVLSVSS